MATLDSSSTTAEIAAAYLDNAGYFEDASVTMAKAFVTACTAMLTRGITVLEHGGERMEFSPRDLRAMIDDAKAFTVSNAGIADGGGGVHHADFREFRS